MMVLKELERLDDAPFEVSDGDLVLEGSRILNLARVVFKNGETEGRYKHRVGITFDRLGVDENLSVCEDADCFREIPTPLTYVHPYSKIQVSN